MNEPTRCRWWLRGATDPSRWPVLAACSALACTSASTGEKKHSIDASGDAAHAGFVEHQRILYSDGLHNENTVLSVQGDRVLLAFRGGESGQIGSGRAHINIYASDDLGKTFEKQSEVDADSLPDGR